VHEAFSIERSDPTERGMRLLGRPEAATEALVEEPVLIVGKVVRVELGTAELRGKLKVGEEETAEDELGDSEESRDNQARDGDLEPELPGAAGAFAILHPTGSTSAPRNARSPSPARS